MKRSLWILPLVSTALACAADRPSAASPHAPLSPGIPSASDVYAEPEEYRHRPPSIAAGEDYFNRIGVGDPYGAGIPYPVFLALQSLYPDELGGDWLEFSRTFGTIPNRKAPADPRALPVGFHRTLDPQTRVEFLVANCQLCHAELVRTGADEAFVIGLGNKRLRLHDYDAALVRIADDPKLDAAALSEATRAAARQHGLSWPPDHREAIVAEVLRKLRLRANVRRADSERLAAGLPGRVATIEGFMLALNEQAGTDLALPDALGWVKIPDVAPWRYRETNSFDGVAFGDPVVTVAEADFAFGVRPHWYLTHPHIATSIYLYLRAFARELPFPGAIDRERAAVGAVAFAAHCSGCHGEYEGRYVGYTEQIVPHAVVGTDRARIDAVTPAFEQASEQIAETRGLVVTRKSIGYVPRPLVNVWARGSYGHAGQWPDLATLALPPEQRPQRFVVDPGAPLNLERVGVSWTTGSADRTGQYVYDAAVPGHGTGGHTFLSERPAPERAAILEYLKTL